MRRSIEPRHPRQVIMECNRCALIVAWLVLAQSPRLMGQFRPVLGTGVYVNVRGGFGSGVDIGFGRSRTSWVGTRITVSKDLQRTVAAISLFGSMDTELPFHTAGTVFGGILATSRRYGSERVIRPGLLAGYGFPLVRRSQFVLQGTFWGIVDRQGVVPLLGLEAGAAFGRVRR